MDIALSTPVSQRRQTATAVGAIPPRVAIVGGPDVDARLDLMDHLRAAGYAPFACGTAAGLASRFAAAGHAYHAYSGQRSVSPAGDLRSFGQLVRLFRRLAPAIVHTFDTKPAVVGRLAARAAGVPVVVGTLSGLGSLYTGEGARIGAVRRAYELAQAVTSRLADATVFQKREDEQELVRRGVVPAASTRIIRSSGVRTDLFDPAGFTPEQRVAIRSSLGLAEGAVVVTTVSRVMRSKGVLDLCDAADALRQTRPEVQLLLVGGLDEDSPERLTAAEIARVRRSLLWAGPRSDVPAVLAASDVFCFPSYYREGIPRALLEAASMALPLVAYDGESAREVVSPGENGLLIPSRSVPQLAQALLGLAESPALRRRLGAAARARARAEFDLSVVAAQVCDLYGELLRRRGLGR
jgi:glycosyltransferase involved in cell wall biosynthesis